MSLRSFGSRARGLTVIPMMLTGIQISNGVNKIKTVSSSIAIGFRDRKFPGVVSGEALQLRNAIYVTGSNPQFGPGFRDAGKPGSKQAGNYVKLGISGGSKEIRPSHSIPGMPGRIPNRD